MRERGELYILAHVDDPMIIASKEKAFIKEFSNKVLLKVTGELTAGSERSFLGRRLKRNGDSIDVSMSPSYIDNLLDLCGTQKAKYVRTIGFATVSRTVSEEPLREESHELCQAAVGKLLWLALICGDISHAIEELSRRVTAPTEQSLAKFEALTT